MIKRTLLVLAVVVASLAVVGVAQAAIPRVFDCGPMGINC